MALATFNRFTKSGKSALILVKHNKFVFSMTPVYVPASACEGMDKGDTFDLPDGYTLVDMIDMETGEARTSDDGSHLKRLEY
tara:strand:+ start:110 stop:355 length:246 start_codon:yes stop_codon:yes gene_type:complete